VFCHGRRYLVNSDIDSVFDAVRSYQLSNTNTHYDPGALIPECNGLSQFIEDIGKPSIPVREFNPIACPLFQSC